MLRQEPDTVHDIVLMCICLHNLMRIRYPGLQNALMDQGDNNHNVIPGGLREGLKHRIAICTA